MKWLLPALHHFREIRTVGKGRTGKRDGVTLGERNPGNHLNTRVDLD